jgi:hypothetical protein
LRRTRAAPHGRSEGVGIKADGCARDGTRPRDLVLQLAQQPQAAKLAAAGSGIRAM